MAASFLKQKLKLNQGVSAKVEAEVIVHANW